MKVLSCKNHQTTWWILQHTTFDYRRVTILSLIFCFIWDAKIWIEWKFQVNQEVEVLGVPWGTQVSDISSCRSCRISKHSLILVLLVHGLVGKKKRAFSSPPAVLGIARVVVCGFDGFDMFRLFRPKIYGQWCCRECIYIIYIARDVIFRVPSSLWHRQHRRCAYGVPKQQGSNGWGNSPGAQDDQLINPLVMTNIAMVIDGLYRWFTY